MRITPDTRLSRRTLIPITSIAALSLAVAGCASSGDSEDGTITLSVLRSTTNVPTDEQLEAYTEATDGRVQFDVTDVPFGQYADKVSVLGSSSNAPDIYGYDMPMTANYASQGLLLPLDDYLPEGWREDVLPATLDEATYEDSVYTLGVQQDVLSLYYNKDLTDAAGIDVPTTLEEVWTWEEARDAMLACQQGEPGEPEIYGLAPTQLGAGTPGPIYSDLLFLRSAGDPDAPEGSSEYQTFWAISPDGGEVDGWLNTPEAVEAAQFYQSLYVGDQAVTSQTGRPNAFVDGIACFEMFPTAMVDTLIEADVPFEWGNAPLPYINTPIVHTGAITVGVGSQTDYPEEAVDFVTSISTGEGAEEYASSTLRMPTLVSVYEALPQFHESPQSMFFEELETWGQPRPPTSAFSQYSQIVETALRDIAYGADPETELNNAVEQLTPLLP